MIFVDTSVWVSGFRGDPAVKPELSRLLDADLAALASPVRLELIEGSRSTERAILRRLLSAVPTYVPQTSSWEKVESWLETTSKVGQRFGVIDLLIGAVAHEEKGSIWSLDSDFERLANLRLVKLHRPRRRP